MSADKARRMFDEMAIKVESDLKVEVKTDITEAGHKTVHIVSDHGTSSDALKTKKNVVVASWTTKDFVLKTDTIDVIPSISSQTGLQIKTDMKKCLEEKIGLDSSFRITWKTDNASNEANARKPNSHASVQLKIVYDGSCIDHTMHLVGQDALEAKFTGIGLSQVPKLKEAVKKMKTLVNYLSDASNARRAFNDLMIENNIDPRRIVKGTSNRFFTKYFECERFIELRVPVEMFIDSFDNLPDSVTPFEEEEWELLVIYRDAMSLIVKAATVLEGRDYPTSSSVIPYLDTIHTELVSYCHELNGEGRSFVQLLIENMVKDRRFGSDLYKTKSPYNILTLLDVRYGDLY